MMTAFRVCFYQRAHEICLESLPTSSHLKFVIKHCFERFCLFSGIPTALYKCLHLPFHLQNKGGAASFEMKPLWRIDVE